MVYLVTLVDLNCFHQYYIPDQISVSEKLISSFYNVIVSVTNR